MSDSSLESIEDHIVERFLEKIESDDEVSDDLVGILRDFSSYDDFGGRDRIETKILDVRGYDED